MLMCFGGKERTVDELTELAADCGLVFRTSTPVTERQNGTGVRCR